MSRPTKDLHGNAPESSGVALLLVDVINDFDYPGGGDLLRHALPTAAPLADLAGRCRAAGVPVVYANDNFGRWRSDQARVIDHCCGEGARGRAYVDQLRPGGDDYFVLKPKHSGFYHTSLDPLLEHLGTRTLVLAGIAAENCVLFTANDAYLRGYRLVVPRDCVASQRPADAAYALHHMEWVLKADTRPAAEVDVDALRGGAG